MPQSGENGFATQFSKNVNNVKTEFVFHAFANRWFLLVTQFNGIPNLYTVRFDLQQQNSLLLINPKPMEYPEYHKSVPVTIVSNFGADKIEIRSSIQFLVDKSKLKRGPTEILVGLGLKQYNSSNLKEIVKILDEIIK